MTAEELLDERKAFDLVSNTEMFEDDYFCKIMNINNINDENRIIYREIYARSLLILNYLFVSRENVAHYTKKATTQKLMFDKSAKFRLNMAILSNDTNEGKSLFDYLGIHSEPLLKKPIWESMIFIGNSEFEQVELNDKEQYGAFVGCFTFNLDCLNQFRLYGKEDNKEGTGVSIVFHKKFFNSEFEIPLNSANEHNPLLYRCVYLDFETGRVVSVGHNEEYNHTKEKNNNYRAFKHFGQMLMNETKAEIKAVDEEYIKKINLIICNVQKNIDYLSEKTKDGMIDKNIVAQLLINLQYLVKDVSFKEEQECRIVKILPLRSKEVEYSEDYNQLYIDFDFCKNHHTISKIIFGPKATGLNLFQNMLWKKEIKIDCKQSTLPLA